MNEVLEIKKEYNTLKEKFLSNGIGEYKILLEEIWNKMIIGDENIIQVPFRYNKYISSLSHIGFNATLTMDLDCLVVQITMQEN